MTDAHGYQVTIQTLRNEADLWDQQSATMAAIAAATPPLQMDRLQAGVFQLLVDAYDAVVTQVIDRAKEGQTAMAGVATGLRTVADRYQAQEQQQGAVLSNLTR
ncbi:hypothetical protein [Kitasatospora azatica]|uniref:hypothetical protein n=1 Tax=Kitasatospora azatica TaxID=58347 RepID=UPI000691E535|nr:hypothetical protein [Kitasatospora azatica]